MSNRLLLACVATIALSLVTAATVSAQDRPNPERIERVISKMQSVRAVKLAEVLEDVPTAKLNAVNGELNKYDRRIFRGHIKLNRTARRLRKAVRRGADDKDINRLIDRVLKLRKELDALRYEQFEKAGRHLSGPSRARLMFFIPEFEKQVRKALRRARRDGKGPPE